MVKITQLPLSMSNACLLSGEKHILVDTGSPWDAGRLKKLLAQHGLGFNDLALILLTHIHFDHAGGLSAVQKEANCPTAVHPLERSFLETGRNAPIVPVHPLAALVSPFMNIPFGAARAEITLSDGFDLSPFGVDAQVLFTPGHTPGSVSILTAWLGTDRSAALLNVLVDGSRLRRGLTAA